MKKTRKKQIVTIALLVIFLGSTFAMFQPEEKKANAWNVKLEIAIFGELQQIPANTGIEGETKLKLYTLEADNIIYKNETGDATLKDFFEIWGENFNSTCIFDYCNNENHSVRMYVNGIENSDYELYVMKNNDVITIDYR